jgi:hypothetical protein
MKSVLIRNKKGIEDYFKTLDPQKLNWRTVNTSLDHFSGEINIHALGKHRRVKSFPLH